ncbi:MAG: molecular chaperone DnaJ [Myxococcota bacterium]
MKRDYYEVLGVARDASPDELKKAYRELARRFHPDRNQDDPTAEDKFKEATEAYRVLSDPEQRKRFDRFGHAAFEQQGPGGFDPADFGSFGDVLEGLLGDLFGGRRRRRRGGRDLEVDLEVRFEEAALGAAKTIAVQRPAPCKRCNGVGAEPGTPVRQCGQCNGTGEVRFQRGFFAASRVCATCNGTGKRIETPCTTCSGHGVVLEDHELEVRIPAGVANGAVRTVRGAGEIGPDGQGDLHITIHVKEHPLFERDGADVLCEVPVSFPQAVLGTTLEIPTLEGKVHMKLPPGTQSGKVFRLRGKGIPVYGGMGKGDQMVTITIEVPEKITREQRRLIEALADEMGTETHPQRASFLDKLKGLFD